jgi:protein-S-isoprenylcysteine O-methyltransferase Ste14
MNGKIIFLIAFGYIYCSFEIYMSIRQKNKTKIVNVEDKGSLRVLYISISSGYFAAFLIAATKIGRIYYWDLFFILGLFIILVGLVIRITSIYTLKHHFTYSVARIDNHELVKKGLYKFIRHPGYLGQLLIFTGLAISLSNWLSVFLMLIFTLAGYIYRIKIEEQFMITQMGIIYSDYMLRTKKLIPKIY